MSLLKQRTNQVLQPTAYGLRFFFTWAFGGGQRAEFTEKMKKLLREQRKRQKGFA
jgi:hypothetical protein